MIADPYRTEPERPMSEITRDKLLIATAGLAAVAATTSSVYNTGEVNTLVRALLDLLRRAREEMGIK